jgi:hypothetical protein
MNKTYIPIQQILFRSFTLLAIVSILISCQLIPVTQQAPTETITPKATQPYLPETFQTPYLNPLDTPHTYIQEYCRYLRNKWNPSNAAPGTVVMAIRFQNINRGTAELPNSIPLIEFFGLMDQLHSQGFEAITTKDLQGFLERNLPIPERSVYLIQDGNHDAEYFDITFRDYWENWGWEVINGWVSNPETPAELIAENIELAKEGFVDHQAQGVFETAKLSDDSAKNVIARELQGSWNGFANIYRKNPLAMIWPNGGFGFRPIEAARQLRFKMGFTLNTRGPIMYNWVPLADTFDPQRPSFIPEGMINDPLMTLPTYSPQEALLAIDTVRVIGKDAAAYAQANKEAELHYYDMVCYPEYPPIPSP